MLPKLLLFTQLISTALFFELESKNCDSTNGSASVVILTKSSTSFEYQVETDANGKTTVAYDCNIRALRSGVIYVNDNTYPSNTKAIVIKNCDNITVDSIRGHYYDKITIEKLWIENVEEVNIIGDTWRGHSIYLSDIKLLILKFNQERTSRTKSISLKNIAAAEFKNLAITAERSTLYLERVNVEAVRGGAIQLVNNSTLLIKDSHFKLVESQAFLFNGLQAQIINNSFENIHDEAFNLVAEDSFIFSGNRINRTENPFKVTSPNVQIVGNTIEIAKNSFFSQNYMDDGKLRTLNFSGNWIFNVTKDLLLLQDVPDFIEIRNNYLTCSCKLSKMFFTNESIKPPNNIVQKILLDKRSQNNCINFGQCPMHKISNRIIDLCTQKFNCSEEDTESESEKTFKSILSTLITISDQLDVLVKKKDIFLTTESSL